MNKLKQKIYNFFHPDLRKFIIPCKKRFRKRYLIILNTYNNDNNNTDKQYFFQFKKNTHIKTDIIFNSYEKYFLN